MKLYYSKTLRLLMFRLIIRYKCMNSPEVIYFEGLPCSGKTTLTRQLSVEYPRDVHSIPEYIHPVLLKEGGSDDQKIFMENDELKYYTARQSSLQCLVDRGHLSTILYTHAYNEIRADRDLKFVDDWYFGTIIKNSMLPDRYVLFDIPAEISLKRRKALLNADNMWDHVEALQFARKQYPRYMGEFESHIPVLTLNSDSMNIAELKTELIKFLGFTVKSP